jgi:hypothetical protein
MAKGAREGHWIDLEVCYSSAPFDAALASLASDPGWQLLEFPTQGAMLGMPERVAEILAETAWGEEHRQIRQLSATAGRVAPVFGGSTIAPMTFRAIR